MEQRPKEETSQPGLKLATIDSQFQLGFQDLENSLTEIVFPKRKKKKKIEQYSMGNGHIAKSAGEAIDLFLQREFSTIANCHEKPHPPVFVPDIFISKLKSKVKNEVK